MTFSQSIDAINAELTKLGLKCVVTGELIEGIGAMPAVAHYHGQAWDAVLDDYEKGAITPQIYHDRMMTLIREYEHSRFRRRLFKRLVELEADQRELDLIKGGLTA